MHVLLNSTSYLSRWDQRKLWWRWSIWFAFFNFIPICLIGYQYISQIQVDSSFSATYFFSVVPSHFSILLAIVFFLANLPLSYIFKNNAYFRNAITVVYTLLLTLLILDLDLYQMFGTHANLRIIYDLLQFHIEFDNRFISYYFLLVPWILFIELLISNFIWRKIFKWHVRSSFGLLFGSLIIVVIIWSNLLYFYGINSTHHQEIIQYQGRLPFHYYFLPN